MMIPFIILEENITKDQHHPKYKNPNQLIKLFNKKLHNKNHLVGKTIEYLQETI